MPASQSFSILLFAALRDAAGADAIRVELPDDESVTVSRLLDAVGAQCPPLARWLPHLRVAVNCAYAAPDQFVAPGDEIALIPPVAGGAW